MTRNGLTGPFYRGLEVIVAGRENTAVVPMFLENLWGSVFSYAGGRVLRKRPRGLRRTVVVVFGPPVSRPITAFAVRQAVLEAGVTACEHRGLPSRPLETLDPSLPHLDHPDLGPLTGSTADHDQDGIRQTGHKPGTHGPPLAGRRTTRRERRGRHPSPRNPWPPARPGSGPRLDRHRLPRLARPRWLRSDLGMSRGSRLVRPG